MEVARSSGPQSSSCQLGSHSQSSIVNAVHVTVAPGMGSLDSETRRPDRGRESTGSLALESISPDCGWTSGRASGGSSGGRSGSGMEGGPSRGIDTPDLSRSRGQKTMATIRPTAQPMATAAFTVQSSQPQSWGGKTTFRLGGGSRLVGGPPVCAKASPKAKQAPRTAKKIERFLTAHRPLDGRRHRYAELRAEALPRPFQG